MSIISARLKNFKSYQDVQIQEFHKHLNVILGSNGHGKSNLIKALLFVFSNKITYSKTQFDSICHKGVSSDVIGNVHVSFEINLQGIDDQILKSEKITIARRWLAKQGEQYLIDNKVVDKTHFSNVIQCLGLSYSDPFNIIMQGKVTQISTMNQHDLYKLLEESTGIRRYMKKRQQGLQNLQKLDTEKLNYAQYLQDIHKKLKTLEKHKKQYEHYQQQQAHRKRQLYKHYDKQHVDILNDIEKTANVLKDQNKQISIICNKKRQLEDQLNILQTNIGVLTQKLQIYNTEHIELPLILTQTEIENNGISLKDLTKQKQTLQKQIIKDKKSYETERKSFEQIKGKYEAIRLEQSLANSSQRAKLIERSIRQYNSEIGTLKQLIKSYEKNLSELNKLSESFGSKKQDIVSIRQKNTENQKTFKIIQNKVQENKIQKIRCNRRKNEILIQTGSVQQTFLKQFGKLNNRINQLINFELIQELNQRQIKGVYGYVVDHLEFDPDVAFAYDIATKNKFFSILVEDEDAVKQVIEVNRKIKGSKINIFALSHLRRQPFEKIKYPPKQWAYPLMNQDWVKIKDIRIQKPSDFNDCLQKLLNQVLGKYVLVDQYNQGLEASKTYHLNAITSKGEIVFSGGIFSKVGEMQIGKATKLLDYSKIKSYKRELDDLNKQDQSLVQKIDQLDNDYAKLLKQFKESQQQYKKTSSKLAESQTSHKAQVSVLQNQRKLKQSIQNSNVQIQKKQRMKANLQRKKESNIQQISREEFQKTQEQFKRSNKLINIIMQAIYMKEQRINELSGKVNNIQCELENNKRKDQESKFKEQLTDIGTIVNIKKQIQVTSQRITDVSVQMLELEEKNAQIQGQAKKYSERLGFLQINSDELKHKKIVIGEEVDLRGGSDEDYVKDQNKNTSNRIFTAKDKVLFNKYSEFKKEIDQYQDKLDYITATEQKLKQFISKSDVQANESMNSTVEKFTSTFQKVMKSLEPNATCDIRLKKLNQKNQRDKYKSGLDIRIGFKSQKGETVQRKMSQLSGGQKSIIAIAFVISLQMCSSTLFYAFDQVDAALDITYAKKIANLLFNLSKKSQYFMTTFKPYIMQLAQDEALYLQVFNNERVSKVQSISVNKAVDIVTTKEQPQENQNE